jgi:hypothetical protein
MSEVLLFTQIPCLGRTEMPVQHDTIQNNDNVVELLLKHHRQVVNRHHPPRLLLRRPRTALRLKK